MSPSVAIVGATGVVGEELLAVLAERSFPVGRLGLFASARSAGRRLSFAGREIEVQETDPEAVAGHDLVFLSAGASVSRELRPALLRAGCRVADNTSAFRLDPEVPLVVPEINADAMAADRPWVAVPNCTAILLNLALAPLHRAFGLRRVVVSTYQAVSGAGRQELERLQRELAAGLAEGKAVVGEPGTVPLAYNVVPCIGPAAARAGGGWDTGEEQKVVAETRRLLAAPELPIHVTCVRVPVLRAHSESVWLELQTEASSAELARCLAAAPGVELDDPDEPGLYPHPIAATGIDGVRVGRLRAEGSGFSLFLSGDQLRKGAALNAVQIAELHWAR